VVLGEGSSRDARITSQDEEGGGQGLTVPKASTSRVMVHGAELGYDHGMGKFFCSPRLGPGSWGCSFLSPADMDTSDTGENEPAEASRGMY
jgi:hypothetical protein